VRSITSGEARDEDEMRAGGREEHEPVRSFALRATGEIEADVAETDFVGYFSADEQERIFYAREGTRGASVRMLHVPIADPEAVAAGSAAADPARTASLFLLIDNQGGVGDARTGIPQIEALLARLPLALP
jgi:two-component system cell cycle sensor histidine kinase/response regulator CckA